MRRLERRNAPRQEGALLGRRLAGRRLTGGAGGGDLALMLRYGCIERRRSHLRRRQLCGTCLQRCVELIERRGSRGRCALNRRQASGRRLDHHCCGRRLRPSGAQPRFELIAQLTDHLLHLQERRLRGLGRLLQRLLHLRLGGRVVLGDRLFHLRLGGRVVLGDRLLHLGLGGRTLRVQRRRMSRLGRLGRAGRLGCLFQRPGLRDRCRRRFTFTPRRRFTFTPRRHFTGIRCQPLRLGRLALRLRQRRIGASLRQRRARANARHPLRLRGRPYLVRLPQHKELADGGHLVSERLIVRLAQRVELAFGGGLVRESLAVRAVQLGELHLHVLIRCHRRLELGPKRLTRRRELDQRCRVPCLHRVVLGFHGVQGSIVFRLQSLQGQGVIGLQGLQRLAVLRLRRP